MLQFDVPPPPGRSEEDWDAALCVTCEMYLRRYQVQRHLGGLKHSRCSDRCKIREWEERQRREQAERQQQEEREGH